MEHNTNNNNNNIDSSNDNNNGVATSVVDRLSETEHWNNEVNEFTAPSSESVFDPIQQQQIEEFQRLLQRELEMEMERDGEGDGDGEGEGDEEEQTVDDDHQKKEPNYALKTLIFIGYCISTILFSLHLWVQYFFVKYTYDDQTAVNMMNYVTAAQERAIDEYSKRNEGDKDER